MKIPFPKVNQVILVIIIAEFIFITGFGFLPPLFAVFVTSNIVGGSIAVVGFALTIYWVTKSIVQLFVARYIDRNHGEIDDFHFFLAGGLLNAVLVTLYYFAQTPFHIYALHFLIGIGDALWVPPFYAIFTRHIDKEKEGFEWSLYSSFSIGAGSALGAAVGGILGTIVGFRAVFPFVGVMTLIATILLFFLKPYIKPKVSKDVMRVFIEKK